MAMADWTIGNDCPETRGATLFCVFPLLFLTLFLSVEHLCHLLHAFTLIETCFSINAWCLKNISFLFKNVMLSVLVFMVIPLHVVLSTVPICIELSYKIKTFSFTLLTFGTKNTWNLVYQYSNIGHLRWKGFDLHDRL